MIWEFLSQQDAHESEMTNLNHVVSNTHFPVLLES